MNNDDERMNKTYTFKVDTYRFPSHAGEYVQIESKIECAEDAIYCKRHFNEGNIFFYFGKIIENKMILYKDIELIKYSSILYFSIFFIIVICSLSIIIPLMLLKTMKISFYELVTLYRVKFWITNAILLLAINCSRLKTIKITLKSGNKIHIPIGVSIFQPFSTRAMHKADKEYKELTKEFINYIKEKINN